jgi:SPP1 gp7 family putative phage head morphogenesis protein
MLPERYYAQGHYEKLVSFSFANAASIEQVRYIQDQLTDVYRRGGTFRDFKKLAQDGALALDLPSYRLENIFRTNIMTAYARGSYLEQAVSAEVFPWGKYTAIHDSATRPTHRALDGVVVKVGSAEYVRIYPPNGYNCRCVMVTLTDKQAERERKYSDAETKSIIAKNPPDKGFEGSPFYGAVPEELLVPPKMTEKQLLSFLDAGETATVANYQKFMEELASAGINATPKQVKAAKVIPDVVVAAKKQQVKLNLDQYMGKVAPKNLDEPIPFTKEELEIKENIKNDIIQYFKDNGLITEATQKAKNEAIKNIMYEVFGEMNNRFGRYTNEERWAFYEKAVRAVDNMKRSYDNYDYSALAMRLLDIEDRVLLNFYTSAGDEFTLDAMTDKRGTDTYTKTLKYYEALNGVYNAFDKNFERKPVKLYRGITVNKKWTDKAKPGSHTTLVDVLRSWKPDTDTTFSFELQNSFSDQSHKADGFIHVNEGIGVRLEIVSTRAAPISSISKFRSESEHLMRNGEKYRILGVQKLKTNKYTMGPTYIVQAEHIEPGDKVEYEFSV